MLKSIFITTALLLLINTLIVLMFSSYQLFNYILVSVTIVSTGGIIAVIYKNNLADAFKIALFFLSSSLLIVKVILSLFAPYRFQDNVVILGLISLIVIEFLFIAISVYLSSKNT